MRLYLHSHFMLGALAQLVEQWTENPCVPGSIPGGTTLQKKGSFCSLFLWSKNLFIACSFRINY